MAITPKLLKMKTPSLSHNGVEETTGAFEMAELQPQDFEDETPAANPFGKAVAEHLYLLRVLCLAIFTLCFAFLVSSTGREDEVSTSHQCYRHEH